MNGIESVINPDENTVVGKYVEDIDDDMPFEILQHAKEAVLETLPKKSREKYIRVYNAFKEWQKKHGTECVSNDVILAYMHMLATEKKYKPTSLWAYFSMLKATLRTYENVHIEQYKQVSAYLSVRSAGYKKKKARVFSEENIKAFIDQADELSWLDVKVATIFGICGALRTDEYTRITLKDVEIHGDLFLVQIPDTKTKWPRSFTISGSFAVIVQKFINLRPASLKSSDRLFTNYQRGKCTRQFMGKNKFSHMPRRVAAFLGLPEPDRHTGHAFRRTSATFLANSGADIETIMRHGGWRHASCAKEYIEDSLAYKARTGNMIQRSIQGISVPLNASMNEPMNASTHSPINAPIIEPTIASINSPIHSSINVPSSMNGQMIASINAPMNGPIHSPINAPSRNGPMNSPIHQDNSSEDPMSFDEDVIFPSEIPDDELIAITDSASQSYEQSKEMCVNNNIGRGNVNSVPDESASSTVLSQSTSNSLNAILSRSFKSVNFEKMENCKFNFYFRK